MLRDIQFAVRAEMDAIAELAYFITLFANSVRSISIAHARGYFAKKYFSHHG